MVKGTRKLSEFYRVHGLAESALCVNYLILSQINHHKNICLKQWDKGYYGEKQFSNAFTMPLGP